MVDENYKVLIEIFPLIPIKDESHLDRAHEVAQKLMLRQLSESEDDYLQVLLDEIAKFEKKFHELQLQTLSPLEILLSFLDDHGLKQVDIAKILSVSSGVANEIVKGKRELTNKQCVKLGEYFKISPAAFLPKVHV